MFKNSLEIGRNKSHTNDIINSESHFIVSTECRLNLFITEHNSWLGDTIGAFRKAWRDFAFCFVSVSNSSFF